MTFENIAQFLGGLGLFMLGIIFFDESTRKIASGGLKNIIKRATNSIFKSIGIGFGATLLLQGSSAVLLILESFVSAGMIEFSHAVKVILGANIGSSTIGVLLGTLGLEFNLASIALPALGILVLLFFIIKSDKAKNILKIIIGLCLIFLGLDYMNTGMGVIAQYADFEAWAQNRIGRFFVIGLFGTVIVQSSSISIALTLSAANAGLIDYRMGIMLLLGAFIGTTATALLGCIEGGHLKKQVAASQVIFNVTLSTIGVILMPVFVRILNQFSFSTFVGLAIFTIAFKLIGVLCMIPFVGKFTALIKKLFPKKDFNFGLRIQEVSPKIISAGITALREDLILILKKVFKHCLNTRNIDEKVLFENNFDLDLLKKYEKVYSNEELRAQYDEIKEVEQTMLVFITKLRQNLSKKSDIEIINSYQESLSNVVYATKFMKDVHKTIGKLKESDNDYLMNIYNEFKKILIELYKNILQLIEKGYSEKIINKIYDLINQIKLVVDKKALDPLIANLKESKKDATIISDTLYVDHYFHLSCLSLVSAGSNLYGKDMFKLSDKKIFGKS